MLQGYTFDGKKYPAAEFAKLQNAMLNKRSGILEGFTMSNTNRTITIEKGLVVLNGRTISNVGNEYIEVEELQTGELFSILIIEVNLNDENVSNDDFLKFKILQNATQFPSLIQEDINNDKNIYQFELARFKNTPTGITNFEDTRKFISFEGIYAEVERTIQAIKNFTGVAFKEDLKPINITNHFTTNYTKRQFRALYYPYLKKVELNFRFDNIPSGDWMTLASTTNVDYKNIQQVYDIAYGNEGQFAAISMNNGALQVLGKSGQINMVSGSIFYYTE